MTKLEKDKQELLVKNQSLQNQIMEQTTSSINELNNEKQQTLKILEKLNEQKSETQRYKQDYEVEQKKFVEYQHNQEELMNQKEV